MIRLGLLAGAAMALGVVGVAAQGRQAAGGAGESQAVGQPVQKGYYLQPAIHGDTVVFVSEGDLWRVPASGGLAARLTSHPGDESHPAISPDGQSVAFTAEYEGPVELYVMPISGGLPRRLTWGAGGRRSGSFVGWTPDGRVMFSTGVHSTLPSSQLVLVDPSTGARERVPLYEADQGVFDRAGGTLFFTRLPFQGSHTKRYKGGFVQQLWSFSPGAAEAAPLTADYAGTSKDPMWFDGRVYFASDRDGIMNIWSMGPDGSGPRQHTSHAAFDAQSPAMHEGRIVYQLGADLRLLDVRTGEDRELDVRLSSDFDQLRENWVEKPLDYATSASISHDGSRVVITARGRVFVAPARQGRFVQAARESGVRYRAARFLPDGDRLVALSDRSGEVEWWTLPANGVGEPEQVTSDGVVLRWEGVPSPDGKLLAHHDKNQRLFVTDLQTKTTTQVASSSIDAFRDLAWSPDSKWLAFVEPAANFYAQVKLYGVESRTITAVTSDRYDSFSPRFSPEGDWLYLLSNRAIRSVTQSPWGAMAPEPFFDQTTKVYHVALRPGLRSPWRPDDELKAKDDKKDEQKDEKKDEKPADEKSDQGKPEQGKAEDSKTADAGESKPKAPVVKIELEGIMSRLEEVPLPAGNYSGLLVGDKAIFFGSSPSGFDPKTALMGVKIDAEKPEVKQVASDVTGYELSGDGKKLLVRRESGLFVVDASPAPAELDKGRVDLSGWTMSVSPAEEFAQMYDDAWRLLRDYFYATNMHGLDWAAQREKYRPLLKRVRSRAELNDVLAQLTGELAALHHFVAGGDLREGPDQVGIGWLGGELVRDEASGGYRVDRVFAFDPDEPDAVPPLARPGVDVKAGDLITHINGVALLSVPDPAVLLRNQAGRQVLIRVVPAGRPEAEARDAIVTPVSSGANADLRYREWQHTRRTTVERLSEGRIGYVHLRAMGAADVGQFARHFYPVFNREGLIIDVRRNGGGNIDSWILSRLMRQAWMFWNQRVGQAPAWNMQYAFRGRMVVICDNWTGSDGEAFSEGFRRLGLGKVLGTRTWGGMIWLTFSNELADKGVASAGEFGVFGPEGAWLIEGHGVEPDIVVDNLPHATFNGQDAQLLAAIEHLKKEIAANPVPPVQAPPLPDKSRRTP